MKAAYQRLKADPVAYAAHIARTKQRRAAARVQQQAGAPAALSLPERLEAAVARAERAEEELYRLYEAVHDQEAEVYIKIDERKRELEKARKAAARV